MNASELLVLPSNASSDRFPNNKNHTYVTRLPKRLRLQAGQWQIGLRAYSFPFNWENVTEGNNTIDLKIHSGQGYQLKTLTLAPGRYRTPRQLCKEINKQIRANNQHEKIRIDYDDDARMISMWWATGHDISLTFKTVLAAMVGCKAGKEYRKLRPVNECSSCQVEMSPDMNAGYHRISVYCSLCADRITGDALVPLLLDIPVPDAETTTRLQVDKSISLPQYVPVQNIDTDEIEINIRSGDGEEIPFRGGLVSMTVELKRTE